MKEFVVYTGMRIGLFLAWLLIVYGVWAAVADRISIIGVVAVAFLLSGVASYFLLNRQREAFARRVDERARRMSQRYEEMKSKEDTD